MGKIREMKRGSFPSPSSSSSSSDFEFTVTGLSPSSRRSSSHLCPADELFYKGQILPLHLSPRISMVRTLLLASSSTSSSSTATTSSRDSNGSSSSSASTSSAVADLIVQPECSAATEEGEALRVISSSSAAKRSKYFSTLASRFSVFLQRSGSKKDASATSMDPDFQHLPPPLPSTGKRSNSLAKQVIKKYVKKVKPFYEKLIQNPNHKKKTFSFSIRRERDITLRNCDTVEPTKKLEEEEEEEDRDRDGIRGMFVQSHSFSGNLRYPRRERRAGSCPSSMRSSPTHSGLLRRVSGTTETPTAVSSSMEELQNAVQGAIAHCKSTMIQSNQKKKKVVLSASSNDLRSRRPAD